MLKKSIFKCQLNNASFKAMRIYTEGGVEKVASVPGKNTVFVVLNVATGAEIAYSGDGTAAVN